MPKIFEPEEVNKCISQMDEIKYQDAYRRLVNFCMAHRHYSDPIIEIPMSWSGAVFNCLSRLISVEPAIKIRKIINEDCKLRIYHNYCPRKQDELERIKVNTYNAIDRMILHKIDQLLNDKSRVA